MDKVLATRWKDVQMGRVLSYSKGSVIAMVEVEAMGDSVPKGMEIKSVIEQNAVRGSINGVSIEPTTIHVEELRKYFENISEKGCDRKRGRKWRKDAVESYFSRG